MWKKVLVFRFRLVSLIVFVFMEVPPLVFFCFLLGVRSFVR